MAAPLSMLDDADPAPFDADLHFNSAVSSYQPQQILRCAHFARSWYSPVDGFTFTLSPVPTNSGTLIVTPFSSFAGFDDAVFVAVFITGAVSTTSSTSEFGILMPTGFPS